MQNTEHPDHDLLRRYILQADAAQFDELRLHLASCPECRSQVDAMMALQQQYPWLENPACDEQQQQLIADYVDGLLDSEAVDRVQRLLDENPAAMKSALHYASHRAAMQQAGLATPSSAEPFAERQGMGAALRGRFSNWLALRPPVWMSVPITVMAVLLVVMILDVLPFQDTGYEIVSYQDNPVIQFRSREPLPGIGFFNRADMAQAEYDDLNILIPQLGEVTLHWQPVEGAISYTMRLQVFHQGEKITLGEISTADTRARFVFDELYMGSRFEWVLSGHTRDDKTFQADGGFVIADR